MTVTLTEYVNGSMAYALLPVQEMPTGEIDGKNSTFTLSLRPREGSLSYFKNGVFQCPGTDYSFSGVQILATTPPAPDDLLHVQYLGILSRYFVLGTD